jgi:hypothetical protein
VSWTIYSGPRRFDALGDFDMDLGWAYTLDHDGKHRTVRVIVTDGRTRSRDVPTEVRRAIRTKGRSAVDAVLHRDLPPRYLIVGSAGIAERHE